MNHELVRKQGEGRSAVSALPLIRWRGLASTAGELFAEPTIEQADVLAVKLSG